MSFYSLRRSNYTKPPALGLVAFGEYVVRLSPEEMKAIFEAEYAFRNIARCQIMPAGGPSLPESCKNEPTQGRTDGDWKLYEALHLDEAFDLEETLPDHVSYVVRAMFARWTRPEYGASGLLFDRSFAVRSALLENTSMLEAFLKEENDEDRIYPQNNRERLKEALSRDFGLRMVARAQLPKLTASAAKTLWSWISVWERERMQAEQPEQRVCLVFPMQDKDGFFQWKENHAEILTLTSPEATAMAVDRIFETFVQDRDERIESGPMTVEIDEFRRTDKLCQVFHSSPNPAVRMAAARWVKGDYDCWRDYAFDEDLAVRREVHELCEDADEYEADDYIDFLGNDPERLVEHAGALLRTDFAEWSRRLLRDEDPEVRRAALPLVLAGVTHGAGRRPVEEDADDDIVVSNGWNDDDVDDWLDEEDDEDDSDEEEEEDEEEDAEEDAKGSRKADTESQDPEKPLQS